MFVVTHGLCALLLCCPGSRSFSPCTSESYPENSNQSVEITSFYVFSNEGEGVCLDQYCSEDVKTEMALGRVIVRPVCVTSSSKTDDGAGPPFARRAARDIAAITI